MDQPVESEKLAKKTKNEIIEAYDKLVANYQDIKGSATKIAKPENQQLVNKIKELSIEEISNAIASLKQSINNQLNNVTDNLAGQLNKFVELSKAIELLEEKLKINYNIEIAADTLDKLISDFAEKQKNLDHDFETKQSELTYDISQKKRQWQMEQEEYQFKIELDRKKNEEEYAYESQKRIKMIDERETVLNQKETKFVELETEVKNFPTKLQETIDENNAKWQESVDKRIGERLKEIEQERKSEKALTDLRITGLNELIERQKLEIENLKTSLDRANQRAQDLASKVVESSSLVAKSEIKPQAEKTNN